MDPQAAFETLVDLLGTEPHDAEAIQEVCENLASWLRNGGFEPRGFRSRWEADEKAAAYFKQWCERPVCECGTGLRPARGCEGFVRSCDCDEESE